MKVSEVNKVVQDLIGIPFIDKGRDKNVGIDCLGLLLLIGERIGRKIPDFAVSCFDAQTIEMLYENEKTKWPALNEPEQWCIVTMARSAKYPESITHFGCYIGQGKMIHAVPGVGVICSKITDPKYKNTIRNFYKWNK